MFRSQGVHGDTTRTKYIILKNEFCHLWLRASSLSQVTDFHMIPLREGRKKRPDSHLLQPRSCGDSQPSSGLLKSLFSSVSWKHLSWRKSTRHFTLLDVGIKHRCPLSAGYIDDEWKCEHFALTYPRALRSIKAAEGNECFHIALRKIWDGVHFAL